MKVKQTVNLGCGNLKQRNKSQLDSFHSDSIPSIWPQIARQKLSDHNLFEMKSNSWKSLGDIPIFLNSYRAVRCRAAVADLMVNFDVLVKFNNSALGERRGGTGSNMRINISPETLFCPLDDKWVGRNHGERVIWMKWRFPWRAQAHKVIIIYRCNRH